VNQVEVEETKNASDTDKVNDIPVKKRKVVRFKKNPKPLTEIEQLELDCQNEIEIVKKKAEAHNRKVMTDINESFKAYFVTKKKKKKKTRKNKA